MGENLTIAGFTGTAGVPETFLPYRTSWPTRSSRRYSKYANKKRYDAVVCALVAETMEDNQTIRIATMLHGIQPYIACVRPAAGDEG